MHYLFNSQSSLASLICHSLNVWCAFLFCFSKCSSGILASLHRPLLSIGRFFLFQYPWPLPQHCLKTPSESQAVRKAFWARLWSLSVETGAFLLSTGAPHGWPAVTSACWLLSASLLVLSWVNSSPRAQPPPVRRADLAQLLILGLHRVGGDGPSTADLETLCLLASQRGLSLELLFGISGLVCSKPGSYSSS